MSAERYDAIVVGGGFAGAAAARDLVSAGLRVCLVEARDRLGGRTWTIEADGQRLELGGTWVHWTQPHVWSELTRYGIGVERDDRAFDRAIVGSPPRSAPTAATLERIESGFAAVIGDLVAAVGTPADRLDPARIRAVDTITMAERLGELDLPAEDRGLVEALLYEIAGSPLDEAGILGVLRWLALCGGSTDRWYETNEYRVSGGTRALIDALTADPRLEVRLASPVRAVSAGPDGVEVAVDGGAVLRADQVVVAVPVNVLPEIEFTPALSDSRLDAARRGVGKPHQDKVFVRVRGDIGRVFGHLPPPAPMNFFWTFRRLDGDEQIIMAISSAADFDVTDHDAVAARMREYVPEIDEVLGVWSHSWSASDPYARGGNTGPRPGVIADHLAELQTPVGPIAFAGADIADGWFGYIDGAIESGLRAAGQVRRMRGAAR